MKIAIISYPGVDYASILNFLSPINLFNLSSPEDAYTWEYCSYLPIQNGVPGISLTTSYVGLPLQGFDLLYLPTPALGKYFPSDAEWYTWLDTITNAPLIFTSKKGLAVFDKTSIAKEDIAAADDSLLSGYELGIMAVQTTFGQKAAGKIRKQLNLPETQTTNQESRTAIISRKSAETDIRVELALDGQGKADIQTGIAFLDHMLSQIARHGLFDLKIRADGDLEIDPHHTMEDTAITLGEAFKQAAGDRKGIQRMASATIPMDESLAEVTLDFSGRPYAVLVTNWNDETLAEIPTSLFEHFLESFATAARINLFVRILAGKDNHHMSEAMFKGLAKALEAALKQDQRRAGLIPSTKEVLF